MIDVKRTCIIDIETNNLLSRMVDYTSMPYKLRRDAQLWCIVIRNAFTDESVVLDGDLLTREYLESVLADYDCIVAHNGIKFDFPVLKLFGLLDYTIGYLDESDTLFGRDVMFLDTLILSRILNPDRYLGHSLDSWGERVGNHKSDFRGEMIAKGYITKDDPKGFEFSFYSEEMKVYCIQDTSANRSTLFKLFEEMEGYGGWARPLKMEHKLADLAVRRETLGFYFDKVLALELLKDLTEKMTAIEDSILPILPPKRLGKTALKEFIPPKNQIVKNGKKLSANTIKFADRIGAILIEDVPKDIITDKPIEGKVVFSMLYKGKSYTLPHTDPLEVFSPATLKDLDHIKMFLIDLGWVPLEWRERDLTKDAKKQNLSFDKRVAALNRWFSDTMEGKYKKQRLEILGLNPVVVLETLTNRLRENKPVRVPTSPTLRVGVEKELCPNLSKMGDKAKFAADYALYLTYKHRKSSIAGGDIEDMDFDEETPNTGYLSMYRDEDGRVPTPAIEIGASTSRYRHIGIANIPRATSVYGKEMRSLFGCGAGAVQFGYDFASLEARVMGHYVLKYTDGQSLADMMLAEKPNDIHSVNALKLNIPRSDAKSLTYGILYGAQPAKISKMLAVSMERAQEIYNDFWDAVPALKELKAKVEQFWEMHGKKYIPGIDGRKINIRSKHSILNALFQSTGVIAAKYVNILSMQKLEKLGHCIDPFIGVPSVCEMIAYHDECQLYSQKQNIIFKTFTSKDEAKQFVKEWDPIGGQLSAISEGKSWYVALPNDISRSIEESILDTEKLLKFNVPLGYEWIVHTNWYGCH